MRIVGYLYKKKKKKRQTIRKVWNNYLDGTWCNSTSTTIAFKQLSQAQD